MVIKREHFLWILQGIILGSLSGYYLMGIYLYLGPLLLIALIISALRKKEIKNKLRLWGFIVSATISFFTFVYVPTGTDSDNANKVGNYIESRYGKFDNRTHVDETHKGKIFYNSPGRYPTIIFYEIVDPKDINDIETFARESLDKYALNKVKLVFYEKQNWHGEPGKAGSRGFEFASKKIVVTK